MVNHYIINRHDLRRFRNDNNPKAAAEAAQEFCLSQLERQHKFDRNAPFDIRIEGHYIIFSQKEGFWN